MKSRRTIGFAIVFVLLLQGVGYLALTTFDLGQLVYGDDSPVSQSRALSQAQLKKALYRAQSSARVATLERRTRVQSTRQTYELFDPIVGSARIPVAEIESQGGAEVVLEGNFVPDRTGEQVVLNKQGILEVETHGRTLATYNLGGAPEAINIGLFSIQMAEAVELVRDGTVQILVHWRQETETGISHRVGIFKVIGTQIAKIFDREIARQSSRFSPWQWRGLYQFLRGEEHAFIRWISLRDNGAYDGRPTHLYRWNHWEGVYRLPEWMPGGKLTRPRSKRWNPMPDK